MPNWGFTILDKIRGYFAHDVADTAANNPVKVGLYADEDPRDIVDVGADGDVVNGVGARNGVQYIYNLPYKETIYPDNVDDTYDDVTTTNTSSSIDVIPHTWGAIGFNVISSGSPTRIDFYVESYDESSQWNQMRNDFLGSFTLADASVATKRYMELNFRVVSKHVRIRVEAVGTTASDTFTVDDMVLHASSN